MVRVHREILQDFGSEIEGNQESALLLSIMAKTHNHPRSRLYEQLADALTLIQGTRLTQIDLSTAANAALATSNFASVRDRSFNGTVNEQCFACSEFPVHIRVMVARRIPEGPGNWSRQYKYMKIWRTQWKMKEKAKMARHEWHTALVITPNVMARLRQVSMKNTI